MDIAAINPLALPSLLLSERAALPDAPAIYFALADDSSVLYIGKARRLSERWKSTIHHRYAQLAAMGDIRLAWLPVADEALLDSVEAACIEHFSPVLNKSALSRSNGAGKMADPPMVKMPRLRVRELAEAKGLNMSQLQRQSGVTMPSVRRYWYNTRDGKAQGEAIREIDLEVLAAIARVLSVEVRDLIENGTQGSAEPEGNSLPMPLATSSLAA